MSQFLTTVAFAARAQTAERRIWKFDADRILAQIRALGKNVRSADLAPDDPPWVWRPGYGGRR